MRANGRRRHNTDSQLRESVGGELYFGPTPLDDFGPRMQARLLDQTGEDLILPLHFARIARIEGVMHITGVEYHLRGRKGTPTRHKQSWLCAARPSDGLQIIAKIRRADPAGFEVDSDEEDIQTPD